MRACKIQFDGEELFVIYNGVKIAKRGEPGTLHAIEVEFQSKMRVVQ